APVGLTQRRGRRGLPPPDPAQRQGGSRATVPLRCSTGSGESCPEPGDRRLMPRVGLEAERPLRKASTSFPRLPAVGADRLVARPIASRRCRDPLIVRRHPFGILPRCDSPAALPP